MLDVLRSATTASGERCVMICLTTMTHESSAECLASRTVYLFFILLISLFAVAADSQQSSHTYIHTYITMCVAPCVDSTEYMSKQRRWRQSLGGQLSASKVISFQVALKAVQ